MLGEDGSDWVVDDWAEEEIQRQLLGLEHLSLQDLEKQELIMLPELGCYDDNQVCTDTEVWKFGHCQHACQNALAGKKYDSILSILKA